MSERGEVRSDHPRQCVVSFAAGEAATARRLARGLAGLGVGCVLDERGAFDLWNEDPEAYVTRVLTASRPVVLLVSADYCRNVCSRPGAAEVVVRALRDHPGLTVVHFDPSRIPGLEVAEDATLDARRMGGEMLHLVVLLRVHALSTGPVARGADTGTLPVLAHPAGGVEIHGSRTSDAAVFEQRPYSRNWI